ncbi:MAG: hypothetical protein F4206_13915, partial [Gammaproteobacteria bacterium]|nr:hypothetical protein [Gammaproteobacteria bacterium]
MTGDDVDEANETVEIRLTNPSNAVFAGNASKLEGVGTITDDDLPTVSIKKLKKIAYDEGSDPDQTTDVVISVILENKTDREVTVGYKLGGDAKEGEDYEAPASKSVSIPAGSTSVDLVLKIKDDIRDEPNESIGVTLENPANARLGAASDINAVVRILDDDVAVLSVNSPTVVEGSGGKIGILPFKLTRTPSDFSTLFSLQPTKRGTAKLGNNFLTADVDTPEDPPDFFKAGETELFVNYRLIGDDIDEENETFIVELKVTSRGMLPGGVDALEATGTIEDDDTRGVAVVPESLTVGEADDAGTQDDRENEGSYTVVLDSEPTGDVVVNVASGDTAVATVSKSSLTFTPGDWDEPQSVTVTAVNDDLDNADDERTVTVSNTVDGGTSDYAAVTAPGVAVTVTDDDEPPVPTFSVADAKASEGDSVTFTVTRSGAAGNAVGVTW